MTSTVALFSSQDELEILQKRSDFSELKLIAVTPEADFIAHEAKLNYGTIEDYYDTPRVHQEGVDSLPTVAEICAHLDQLFFAGNPYFSAHNFFYFLKVINDQLLLSSYISKGLLSLEKPTKALMAYLPPLKKDLYVDDNKDILFQTIFLFFKAANVECEFYKKEFVAASKDYDLRNFYVRVKSFLSKKKHFLTCTLSNLFIKKNNKIFIAQHWSYETCTQLSKYFKVYWLSDKSFPVKCRKINVEMFEIIIEDLNKYYIFYDLNLIELIKPRLKSLVEEIAPKFTSLVASIKAFLTSKRIDVIIAAQGQSLETLAATHAGKILGLPVVWGQHGGLYGYADFPISKYMSKDYSHYFLYTRPTATIASQSPYYVISDAKLLRLYKATRYGC